PDEVIVLERGMTDLQRLRVVDELTKERGQLLARFGRVLEAPRKLEQERAEAVGGGERVEVGAEGADVGRLRLPLFVRESLEDLRGEFEIGVGGDAAHPALRVRRRRDAIEGRVDLDSVEKRSRVRQLVEASAVRRVDDSLPVFVAPAGRADADGMTFRQRSTP